MRGGISLNGYIHTKENHKETHKDNQGKMRARPQGPTAINRHRPEGWGEKWGRGKGRNTLQTLTPVTHPPEAATREEETKTTTTGTAERPPARATRAAPAPEHPTVVAG